MSEKNFFDLITAYVDNRISDPVLKSQIEALLESDQEYRFEFQVQLGVKNLLKERNLRIPLPEYKRTMILKAIKKNFKYNPFRSLINLYYNFKEKLSKKIISPAYGFSLATIFGIFLIIFVYLLLDNTFKFSSLDFDEYKENFYDASNYFCQGIRNFELILKGELKAQIKSSNPNELKKFFIEKGVAYSTFIPEFSDWTLLGGVVSEFNGNKHAHYVYESNRGFLVYVYQVSAECLEKNKTLRLSESLQNYLKSHKFVSLTKNNFSILLIRHNNLYFLVISNDKLSKIENNFREKLAYGG